MRISYTLWRSGERCSHVEKRNTTAARLFAFRSKIIKTTRILRRDKEYKEGNQGRNRTREEIEPGKEVQGNRRIRGRKENNNSRLFVCLFD